ncbi:MAG TPA: methyl-accepting chemotaxis protein [Solirubrobacteraceae bacterium]|nr:methyl-accepting chemotaxis protein [Solirubrobacteraceae bacterium]
MTNTSTVSPKAMSLGVRGKLIGLVLALAAVSAICIGVAVNGLLAGRAKSRQAVSTFTTFSHERTAYEGWLSGDEQGYQRARSELTWLTGHAPSAQVRAMADSLRSDLGMGDTQADFNGLNAAVTKQAAAIDASVASSVSSAISLLSVIGVVGLIIAILITVWIVRSITRPLAEMTEAAERIAEGDVDVEVQATSSDEIGRLAHAFGDSVDYLRHMVDAAGEIAAGNLAAEIEPRSERDALGHAFTEMRTKIAGMIREISKGSDTVGTASKEMASSGQQAGFAVGEIANAVGSVAHGAETQVRSLEQVRAVTAEVSAASQASAADAEETASAARAAREVAADGAAAVTRATDAIRAVQSSTVEITATIRELGAMSDQIGGIVDTITAIAEQTNLLALNAAIEAARAGEQGRGFAVVAEEVRKLAEESQTAAASIGTLIGQIQAGTGKAVEVVADGSRQTDESVETVDQAREAFLRIDSSVEDMSERVDRIAIALQSFVTASADMQNSLEQALAVAEQSSASAEQVSATTEETSASTQQIAASAQELATTAEHLQGLVAQFNLA